MTPNNLELVLYQENSLALVMLDSSNLNTSQLSQASGESPDDLSLLDDFPLSYDSGVLIATTLVEGILLEFPITQDSLDSVCTTVVTLGLEGCKSIAYIPQTVLVSPSGHGVASIPIRVLYSHAGPVGTAKDLSSQTTKSKYHVIRQVIQITCKVT